MGRPGCCTEDAEETRPPPGASKCARLEAEGKERPTRACTVPIAAAVPGEQTGGGHGASLSSWIAARGRP